jgi:stage II sporulation protein D
MAVVPSKDGEAKRLRKRLILAWGLLVLAILLIPAILVIWDRDSHKPVAAVSGKEKGNEPVVRVYLTKEKRVEEVPLEIYIVRVVAAEMPVSFQPEALKAQALAARTYIVSRLGKGILSDMKKWGKAAETAQVTDRVQNQAYLTEGALREKWGSHYQENRRKIEDAVRATAGMIITYQGRPIYAAFFSTSNGRTENSEDYFQMSYPYLRSVDSSWDRFSPKFEQSRSWKWGEFLRELERATGKRIALSAAARSGMMQVLQWTDGKRIGKIRIGDKVFTGREVREALGLASSDFSWAFRDGHVVITTRGSGHGVGMSQWGANLMAEQGKTVQEIITHYYRGVKIEPISPGLIPGIK